MPDNFRRVDAPDVLTTFAGFTEMLDRMHSVPVVVSPPVIGPKRAGHAWSRPDEDRLIELYRKGLSIRKIAEGLGRTSQACRVRLYVLGYGRQ